jgi:hypothetical protein
MLGERRVKCNLKERQPRFRSTLSELNISLLHLNPDLKG